MGTSTNKEPTNMLIFGLGSTGAEYVDRLVATLRAHNEELPTNQCYLIMDSFEEELNKNSNVAEDLRISLDKPTDAVLRTHDPDLQTDMKIVASGGAGLNRRLGLAYYRYNREKIKLKVKEVAVNLKNRSAASNFQIVMVTGLFGGTGSACLVDFALDLRDWITSIAGVTTVSIMAVGILPHFTTSPTDQKANALGALKEISFIRRITSGVNISGREFINPFDFFFVVGTEKNGEKIKQTVEWAVTKLLVDLGIIPFKESEDKQKAMIDWANLKKYMSKNISEFSTFGLYTVNLPVPELKWVINTEASMVEDEADLKRVKTSIGDETESGSIETTIRKIKGEVADSGQISSKLTGSITALRDRVSGGFPKLAKQLEKDQKNVDECSTALTETDRRLIEISENIPGRL